MFLRSSLGRIGTLVLVTSALGAAGCGDDETSNNASGGAGGTAGSAGSAGSAGTSGSGGSSGGGDLDPPGDGPTGGVYLLGGSDCDELVAVPDGTTCAFPFPSDVYRVQKNGKWTIEFGATTLPKTNGQYPIDPLIIADRDGFSYGSGLITFMPGAQNANLANPNTIADSMGADSPTVLIEAETGARVPHWVDLDFSASNDGANGTPDEKAFIVRPARLLKPNTRYIVAIRHVKDANGADLPASQRFMELRDGLKTDSYGIKRRRALYADIFGKLSAAGVDKADLQMAWDLTTATKENTTDGVRTIRDLALTEVGADGPTYVVGPPQDDDNPPPAVEENYATDMARRIHVQMTVPMYLNYYTRRYDPTKTEIEDLNRDASGNIVQNGTMQTEVNILVPLSAADGDACAAGTAPKHGLLQNGHGLFGSRWEGNGGYLARQSVDGHWIAFATNFFGFSEDDVTLAIAALGARPQQFKAFFARQMQGHVNQLLAMRMMMGRVARDGIKDSNGVTILDPRCIDNTVRAYRGDSQGGIMGTAYMAISTDVTRGLVGEPGTPYSLLLNRSADWPGYEIVLRNSYDTDLNTQFMIDLIQQGWDRTEPSGYAQFISSDMLTGTPAHQLLIHPALGDHQVTPWGAHIIARAVGAKLPKADDGNVIRDVYDVPQVSSPMAAGDSALVEWEFGLPPAPLTNLAADEGCDPHDRVRDLIPSWKQQDTFFRTGVVEWTCDGICDCTDPTFAGYPNAHEEGRCAQTYYDQCAPNEGDACTTDPECKTRHCDGTTHRCVRQAAGATCTVGDECTSRNCSGGTCQ